MIDLKITEPAQQDIQAAYQWWRDRRSRRQAERWYLGLYQAIESLRQNPKRCPLAPEAALLPQGVRQLLFTIGKRPTHRIVFAIDENAVTILRVRHAAQADLQAEDFTS
ncbi:type II toxin-antitoxin system RelE/ParE family toxin [Blastopirellula marina]|uniref:type II toxin-antitoxin system RelE/ParE family toxin n=1 Tax=Blastopirellula marina TaxID=124 RepID=UPI00031AF9E6|nr:type II toxin-antitoxin system RelE/ParE family toxin [Blastopirellula marina]